MSRRTALAALVAVLVVPTTLAGCGGGDSGSTPSPGAGASAGAGADTTGPSGSPATGAATGAASSSGTPAAAAAPRPRVSACYRLDLDEAVAPTSSARPVPCSRPHTALTYAVGTLHTVVGGHLLAVDSRRVQAQPARTCRPRLRSFLGGSVDDLRLSVLRPVWFTPTVAESDAGADWFRCDVTALAGRDRLASLPGGMAGVLDRAAGDRFAMCGTTEPGRPAFERVACASRHAWRAVRVIPLTRLAGRAGGYPGAPAVRAAGQRTCQDVGQGAARDKLNFSWGYEWPTARQWSEGQTYGRCWVPD